jgi:hypothetical protein
MITASTPERKLSDITAWVESHGQIRETEGGAV